MPNSSIARGISTDRHLRPPAAGLSELVGRTQRKHGICRVKIFEGVKRGLFIKSPLLRAPAAGNRVSMFAAGMFVWHFLFADKGYCPLSIFFCAGAPGKPKPIRRGGIFFAPAAHRSLVIFYMPAVVLLAGGKKYSPHGASQFFALRKTEWLRLTGCSPKRKRRTKESDATMKKVTLRQGGKI